MKFSRISIDTSTIAVLVIKANKSILAGYDLEIKQPGAALKREVNSHEFALGLDDIYETLLVPAVLELHRSGISNYMACIGISPGKMLPVEMRFTGTYANRESIFKVSRCPYAGGRFPRDQWILLAKESTGFDFWNFKQEQLAYNDYGQWFDLDPAFQSFLDDIASKKMKEYESDLLNASKPRKISGKLKLETFIG